MHKSIRSELQENLALTVIAILLGYLVAELAWAEIFNYFDFGGENK